MRFQANVGLMDGRGVAQTLHTLSINFRAVEFADLCTLIEEIVLHEKVFLSGQIERFPVHLRIALEPLLSTGIFIPLALPHRIPTLPVSRQLVQASAWAIDRCLTSATLKDAQFEVSRTLGAEGLTGIAATPLLRNLQHFGVMQRHRIENHVWDLAAQCRAIGDLLASIRSRYQSLASLPVISVPPIPLLAMSRAKDYPDLLPEVLQLRDEFANLRALMTELEERLHSGKLTPWAAFEEERAWHARWQKIVTNAVPNPGRLSLARTSWPLLRGGGKIVMAAKTHNPLPALEAAADLLACVPNALGYMQMRPVHRPVSNYVRMTDEQMKRSVTKMFKYDFARLDGDMKELSAFRQSPWRLAMSPDEVQRVHVKGQPSRAAPAVN